MKKTIFHKMFFFAVGVLCLHFSQAQTSEGAIPDSHISQVAEYEPTPTPGISGGTALQSNYQPLSVQPVPIEYPATIGQDLSGTKLGITGPDGKRRLTRWEKAETKAHTEAVNDAIGQQVEAMRDERSREMPYLDRIYIQTDITPLKMLQKDEFLGGGAKDLPALIQRALSVHTQARAAHENISLYTRRMLVSFRKLFPEVTFDFNARNGVLSTNPYTGEDWKVSLRQPIFNGGVLWNAFLMEKANLEAAYKQYDKTIAELVFDLSRAYFDYQAALQIVDEQRAVVEKMKRFADMSEEKFKEKIISEIEHLNVQSLYSQMQFDLESARQDFEIKKLDMQKYLNLSAEDQVTVARIYSLDEVVQGQAVPAGGTSGSKSMPDVFKGEEKAPEISKLIDLSYGHRAELQVEAAKLQAARFGERIRWGEFLPKAFLTYDFGEFGEAYRYPEFVYAFPEGFKTNPDLKKQWRLMLEMTWNVGGNKVSYNYERNQQAPALSEFQAGGQGAYIRRNGVSIGVLDGLDAYVGVKQAEVDKLNQVVELEKAEKQVLQDVKQAYYDYQKAVIQVNSTVKRLEYRKRLRDFSEYRLSKKEVELSEYLQAESDLVREKAELHRALKDYFSAKAALNHAVGIRDFMTTGTPQTKQKD